ncbi:hypothetical protein ACFQ2K_51830, partial [Streptomyces sanglieri]
MLGAGADRAEGETGDSHRVGVEGGHERVDLVPGIQPGRGHGRPLADAVSGDRVRHDPAAAQRRVEEAADGDHAETVPAHVVGPVSVDCGGTQTEMGGHVVDLRGELALQAREQECQSAVAGTQEGPGRNQTSPRPCQLRCRATARRARASRLAVGPTMPRRAGPASGCGWPGARPAARTVS